MKYVLFFYETKTQNMPSDSYPMSAESLETLSFVFPVDNWLKMHPGGYVRIEVMQ